MACGYFCPNGLSKMYFSAKAIKPFGLSNSDHCDSACSWIVPQDEFLVQDTRPAVAASPWLLRGPLSRFREHIGRADRDRSAKRDLRAASEAEVMSSKMYLYLHTTNARTHSPMPARAQSCTHSRDARVLSATPTRTKKNKVTQTAELHCLSTTEYLNYHMDGGCWVLRVGTHVRVLLRAFVCK